MEVLKNSYSIILPTFNEAGHIKKLISEIYEIFLTSNDLFEIIVVDDNSTDGTSEIISEISKSNNKVLIGAAATVIAGLLSTIVLLLLNLNFTPVG